VTGAWRFAFVGDTHVPLTSVPGEIAAAVASADAKLLIVAATSPSLGGLLRGNVCGPAHHLAQQMAPWPPRYPCM